MAAGEVLFLKVLLFVIVLVIVWALLDLIPIFEEVTWAVPIIAIVVGILSTRFLMTPGWIQTILLPYSALGVALTAFLPLLIYFYFVEKGIGEYLVLRKIAWVLAAVVFIGLYISRRAEIGKLVGQGGFNPLNIYLITAVICILLFIFDGTIRRAFVRSEIKALGHSRHVELVADYRQRLARAQEMHADGHLTDGEYAKLKKALAKKLSDAERY